MIAAFEGAPGVGKSTIAASLRRQGVSVVPEVNKLFLRPVEEPADWYLDRQNARWEIAAQAERDGRVALLDGDPLQPLWFGWLYLDERWTSVTTAASFFIERVKTGRMRVPDRYFLLTLDEAERANRLHAREVGRGSANADAVAKVARYASFALPQRRFFEALSQRFPGWITMVDTADPDATARVKLALGESARPPDGLSVLTHAAEWLKANPSAHCEQ